MSNEERRKLLIVATGAMLQTEIISIAKDITIYHNMERPESKRGRAYILSTSVTYTVMCHL